MPRSRIFKDLVWKVVLDMIKKRVRSIANRPFEFFMQAIATV